jgi:flagellar hook-associated protein 2
MAISSLGLGSGVLTQDVLDQLRQADEAARVTPIDMELALVKDEQGAFSVLDAKMTNLIDSIDALKTPLLYDERTATVTGTSVDVTASANSDLQEFTLNVTQLATKQIEESGSFAATTDTIASAVGSLNLNIDGIDFTINYDSTTTLDDLKRSINDIAGTKVNATIVQVASGDYRLFLNSVGTGSNQNITITDNSGNLSGTQLTSGLTALQTGVDATFEFNGQAITRSSNEITDLVTGYDITLKELGSSNVKVEQNRDAILEKIDSFVEKYNDAMSELGRLTANSTNADERGIFAGNSTIRSMQLNIRNAMDTIGGGVGNIYEYGFDIDKSGKMTFDRSVFNTALDANATNVETFFTGGNFDNGNGTTTAVSGIFNELSTQVGSYTNYDQILDQFKNSLTQRNSELEDRRATAIERLDNKYATLQKQWAAYDAMIARLNSSANAFIDMINTQNATQNN